MITASFDGSCVPINPGGTAACGWIISGLPTAGGGVSGRKIIGSGEEMSCNVAEYSGVIEILLFLDQNNLHNEEIEICGDSSLVINQMSGVWKIKLSSNKLYAKYALVALSLVKKFKKIKWKWIPREQNKQADALSKFSPT